MNKPLTWTSFNLVHLVKLIVNKRSSTKVKVGHAGTLDPLATGVLLICTGKKTKEIDQLQALGKTYTGSLLIGATTPCFDREKPEDATYPVSHISDDAILAAAQSFVGTIQQVPPSFSAAWVDGKRAYDLAREGKEVELNTRIISIEEFSVSNILHFPDKITLDFKVRCSKGTYIRSLARDLGLALHSGAYLTSLCRTAIGPYLIEQALSPEQFRALMGVPQPSQEFTPKITAFASR
jgi:tRNA pseudouridine55 synthase